MTQQELIEYLCKGILNVSFIYDDYGCSCPFCLSSSDDFGGGDIVHEDGCLYEFVENLTQS